MRDYGNKFYENSELFGASTSIHDGVIMILLPETIKEKKILHKIYDTHFSRHQARKESDPWEKRDKLVSFTLEIKNKCWVPHCPSLLRVCQAIAKERGSSWSCKVSLNWGHFVESSQFRGENRNTTTWNEFQNNYMEWRKPDKRA